MSDTEKVIPCRRCGSMAGFRFLEKSLCAECFNSRDKWKVKIPDGMMKAARSVLNLEGLHPDTVELIVEASLRWLSNNPVVPTDEQVKSLFERHRYGVSRDAWKFYIAEWQTEMFIAPEPEVPEEIKDLQGIHLQSLTSQDDLNGHLQILLVEAFRRGKKYVEDRQFIYDRDHK